MRAARRLAALPRRTYLILSASLIQKACCILANQVAPRHRQQHTTAHPLAYDWLDVFTDTPCGGNPLAVVYGAEGLPDAALQKIAREFNLSETTFVLPPADPAHTARVRIFTSTAELPFAGHPNVGTACALRLRGSVFGRPLDDLLLFEEVSGVVRVALLPGGAAQLAAPMPFVLSAPGAGVPVGHAGECLGLGPRQLKSSEGRVASLGGSAYTLVEVADRSALQQCAPDFGAIGRTPPGKVLAWTRAAGAGGEGGGGASDADLFSRMFTARGSEDAATGAANCCLLAMLAVEQHGGGAGRGAGRLARRIVQGVEMGRPSLLLGECEYDVEGVPTAVRIAGASVLLMSGSLRGELFL